jgi:hypothetical protein
MGCWLNVGLTTLQRKNKHVRSYKLQQKWYSVKEQIELKWLNIQCKISGFCEHSREPPD